MTGHYRQPDWHRDQATKPAVRQLPRWRRWCWRHADAIIAAVLTASVVTAALTVPRVYWLRVVVACFVGSFLYLLCSAVTEVVRDRRGL